MELLGKRLILTSVSLNAAETLLLAFNGDRQFNVWSGYASAMTLDQVRTDMAETQNLPGGVVWRITDKTDTLVGVAETALFPPNTAWIALLIICHDFQGRGYGSEAATLLENHLFTYPEMTRIGLAVLVQNDPAMAFWEKRDYVQGIRCRDTQGHDVYEYHLPRSSSIKD